MSFGRNRALTLFAVCEHPTTRHVQGDKIMTENMTPTASQASPRRLRPAPAVARCEACGEHFSYTIGNHRICPACRSMQSFEQARARLGDQVLFM